MRRLAEAFGSYSDITAGRAGPRQAERGAQAAPGLSSGAKEALRLAFAPQGGPVQAIALRELARLCGAAAAEAAAPVLAVASAIAEAAPPPTSQAERRLRGALLFGGALRATQADKETLRVAEEVWAALLPAAPKASSSSDKASLSPATPKSPDLPPGFTAVELPLLGPVPVLTFLLPPPFLFPGQQQLRQLALLPPPPPEVDPEVIQDLLELAPELGAGVQAVAFRFASELLSQAADRVAKASQNALEADQGLN